MTEMEAQDGALAIQRTQFEHAIAMLTGQQMAVSGGLIQALAGGWDAS